MRGIQQRESHRGMPEAEYHIAYVADERGYVHFCNEEIGRGINLFEIDPDLRQLLDGADYMATPIKQRVEDGKTYKFLSVYRNNKIYELGIDLSR